MAQVSGIATEPSDFLFKGANQTQPLKVIATYSDQAQRDVTDLAFFQTNNKTVADVDYDGAVQSGATGATNVFARFDLFTVGAEVVVLPVNDEFDWPKSADAFNTIDRLVQKRQQQLRILPSEHQIYTGDANGQVLVFDRDGNELRRR